MARNTLGADIGLEGLVADGQGRCIVSLAHNPAVADAVVRESLMVLAAGHDGPAMKKILDNFCALGIDIEARAALGM